MRKRAFTEKQREAVRANGRKSRGPVTAQGKANSSRNATRHGILANTIVLDEESRAGFFCQELKALRTFFKPSTIIESTLVENMAISRWRQARVWRLERMGLIMEVRKQSEQSPEFAAQDPATQTARAFGSLCLQSGSFEAPIGRYEARTSTDNTTGR